MSGWNIAQAVSLRERYWFGSVACDNALIGAVRPSRTLAPIDRLQEAITPRHSLKKGCIFSLKWSHDGNAIAGGTIDPQTGDSSISIWSMESFSSNLIPSKVLSGAHSEICTDLCWINQPQSSEKGDFISCSLDKRIVLWKNFKKTHVLVDHNDWIRSLNLSDSNDRFLSGCVSSVICGWDMATQQVLFRTKSEVSLKTEKDTSMNTVNGLCFLSQSNTQFVSGHRHGFVKFWDIRQNDQTAVGHFQAHDAKLNSIELSQCDRFVLTCGRDSSIHLWDRRKCFLDDQPLQTFDAHKCEHFNINASFLSDDFIVTGSEDGFAYIYDTFSGALQSKCASSGGSVVQSVSPGPSSKFPCFLSCSSENNFSTLWEPFGKSSDLIETHCIVEEQKDPFAQISSSLMQTYGERILQIYHANDLSFSTTFGWTFFQEHLQHLNEEDARTMRQMMTEFWRIMVHATVLHNENDNQHEQPSSNNVISPAVSISKTNRNPLQLQMEYSERKTDPGPFDAFHLWPSR